MKNSQNTAKDVSAIRKTVLRSAEAIRDRYKEYLSYLTTTDYQTIYDHVQKSGLNGYLQFDVTDEEVSLRTITTSVPKKSAKKESVQKASAPAPVTNQVNNFFNFSGASGFQGLQQTMATMMQ